MIKNTEFQGFTPETIDFLWGIRMNNERSWFQEHKTQYITTLYEPMKAFGAEIYEILQGRSGDELKVSRIYKDSRMHPSEPYKESLWMSIRRGTAYWAEVPCLFFEIRPDGVSYGFSLWKPKTSDMSTFRTRITADPAGFMALIRETEKKTGIAVTAVRYRRPKMISDDPVLQTYADWKEDIACIRSEAVSADIFGTNLCIRVKDTLRELLPLYDYFNMICSAL